MKNLTWKMCLGVALLFYLVYVAVWAASGANLTSLPEDADFSWREIVDDAVLCAVFAALMFLYNHFFFNRLYHRRTHGHDLTLFTVSVFVTVNLLSWVITPVCVQIFGSDNAVVRHECQHLRHDSTLLSCVFCSMFYLYFFMRSQRQTEELEVSLHETREKELEMQLRLLRVQVDPHFLFNNFSILSGLIEENPAQADRFLTHLTRCYRYITAHLDDTLVTVESALQSLASYYYLMQIRHGGGVVLDIDPSLDRERRSIPPMTLQLLVENAVKHNAHSQASPLRISIAPDGDCLAVSNPKVPMASVIPSTGRGIKNIRDRYKLLGNRQIEVLDEPESFTVKIPLI